MFVLSMTASWLISWRQTRCRIRLTLVGSGDKSMHEIAPRHSLSWAEIQRHGLEEIWIPRG
jgi:hypothetical protein